MPDNGPKIDLIELRRFIVGDAEDGIVGAFNPKDFDRLLKDKLTLKRVAHVADGPFENLVDEVLEYLASKGMVPILITALAESLPMREEMQEIYKKYCAKGLIKKSQQKVVDQAVLRARTNYRLSPPFSVQEGGKPVHSHEPGFERTVNQLIPKLNSREWRKQWEVFERQVCRVDVDGRHTGTGFLVGPNAVLTNYHVLEPAIRPGSNAKVVCRFDCGLLPSGANPGEIYIELPIRSGNEDWLIAHSQRLSSDSETAAFDRPTDQHLSHLDFALIRLPRELGNEAVGAGGPLRGWIRIPAASPAIPIASPNVDRSHSLILQYPGTGNLELALDTSGFIGVNHNGSRIRYTTNTEEGASGAPCFDLNRGLIALHHFGDPNVPSQYNQGIPVHLIRKWLKQLNLEGVLGGPLPVHNAMNQIHEPIPDPTLRPSTSQPQNQRKVVVELDLSRYSDIARGLEQNFGPETIAQLNAQITGMIEKSLETVGTAFKDLPQKGTGDGAIIVFDGAKQASEFACQLHLVAAERNLGKDVELAQRHFRVGIWTDEIVVTPRMDASVRPIGYDFAGSAIANAVRLEAACRTGEVLISSDTWGDLPPADRKLYGPEEVVPGKRDEQFRAHRRRVVDPAPWETATVQFDNGEAERKAVNQAIQSNRLRAKTPSQSEFATSNLQTPVDSTSPRSEEDISIMANEKLFVQLFVPTNGNQGRIGTAFPVAKNVLLTSAHVVGDGPATAVEACWLQLADRDSNTVRCGSVLWDGRTKSPACDVVLLECNFPAAAK